MEVIVEARRYEDADDCLRAAADEARAALDLEGWDLSERWEDEATREAIVLQIPANAVEREALLEYLRSLDT